MVEHLLNIKEKEKRNRMVPSQLPTDSWGAGAGHGQFEGRGAGSGLLPPGSSRRGRDLRSSVQKKKNWNGGFRGCDGWNLGQFQSVPGPPAHNDAHTAERGLCPVSQRAAESYRVPYLTQLHRKAGVENIRLTVGS